MKRQTQPPAESKAKATNKANKRRTEVRQKVLETAEDKPEAFPLVSTQGRGEEEKRNFWAFLHKLAEAGEASDELADEFAPEMDEDDQDISSALDPETREPMAMAPNGPSALVEAMRLLDRAKNEMDIAKARATLRVSSF